MGSYFKPLRRKIGMLTLVMALGLAAGWVRSLSLVDTLSFRTIGEEALQSVNGSVRCWSFQSKTDRNPTVELWVTNQLDEWQMAGDNDLHGRYRWVGIGAVKEPDFSLLVIRYYSIVIPLTMLSTWLLLSKPREQQKAESTE